MMPNMLPHHDGSTPASEAVDKAILAYAKLFLSTEKRLPYASEVAEHLGMSKDIAQNHIHLLALAGIYPTENIDDAVGKPLTQSNSARLKRWHDDMQRQRKGWKKPE